MNLLGVLELDQWLAVLRVGIGLWWIKSVFHKDLRQFLQEGMINWTSELAANHPWVGFGRVMERVLGGTAAWFPYLVVLGELAVGLGLTFGFLTPISALVAIFLNFSYLVMAGVKLKDPSINPCFRVEQGQNWTMIVAEVVIFAVGAGAVWSVDSALGWF